MTQPRDELAVIDLRHGYEVEIYCHRCGKDLPTLYDTVDMNLLVLVQRVEQHAREHHSVTDRSRPR